jgi:hypothetical protein
MNTLQRSGRVSTGAELTNIILGLWVAISPFILGFSQNIAALWSNIGVGIGLVLVALASRLGDEAFETLVVPLAAWLFASPFVLGFSRLAFVANNVGMAFIVIAAGAISAGLCSSEKTRYGG